MSDLLDRLNDISDEEWQRIADELANIQIEKDKQRTEFFVSEEFFAIYHKIVEHLHEHDTLQCEDYNYSDTITPVNYEEFEKITDSISHMTPEIESEDQTFPSWHHIFYDIRIDYISGQGTLSRISLSDRGKRNMKLKKLLK